MRESAPSQHGPARGQAPRRPGTRLSSETFIEIDHVTFGYDASRTILNDLSLKFERGKVTSILGGSGCGKTTLMRLVAGLVPATTGRIAIAGTKGDGPHTGLGIVFQAATLLDWRTVLGNVLLQLELRGLDPKAYEARAIALLKAVGLGDFTGALPRELSGGMKQRAAIVRALVHDPKILLMDEPFGALDALTREQMRLDLEALWLATRKTVLFITHSIDEAVLLADRVVVMSPRPGRIERIIDVGLPRPRGLPARRAPAWKGDLKRGLGFNMSINLNRSRLA